MCVKKPECRDLDLGAFLIKPLQRLCKYPLILKELLKNTPVESADYKEIELLQQRCAEVVTMVNERTRQVERVEKLKEIEDWLENLKDFECIDGNSFFLVVQHRFFIALLDCKTQNTRLIGQSDDHLLVFNDILIFTRQTRKGLHPKYEVKRILYFSELLLSNIEDRPESFDLVHLSKEKIFSFQSQSIEEKMSFCKYLEEQIQLQNSIKEWFSMSLVTKELNERDKLLSIAKQLLTVAEASIKQTSLELVSATEKNKRLKAELSKSETPVPTSTITTNAGESSKNTALEESNQNQAKQLDVMRRETSILEKTISELREENAQLKEQMANEKKKREEKHKRKKNLRRSSVALGSSVRGAFDNEESDRNLSEIDGSKRKHLKQELAVLKEKMAQLQAEKESTVALLNDLLKRIS